MLESTIQHKIVHALRAHGCVVYKFTSDAQRGVPDLVVIAPGGRVYFFEVKQPGKKATLQQQVHIDRINGVGGYACVVTSVPEAMDRLGE